MLKAMFAADDQGQGNEALTVRGTRFLEVVGSQTLLVTSEAEIVEVANSWFLPRGPIACIPSYRIGHGD